MKKTVTLASMFLCAILLTSCTNSTTKEGAKEDLREIEETVKTDIETTKEFSKEKIDEAITYINTNIDKVKDVDISKKMYEYSVYLESATKHTGVAVEHDVAKFATKVKDYTYNIYTASKDNVEDLIKTNIDSIKEQGSNLVTDGKNLVDEFHKLINGQ